MSYAISEGDVEVIEKCFVCGGTNHEVISEVHLGNLNYFTTACCTQCGFVFRLKRPSLDWFENAWMQRTNNKTMTFSHEFESRRYRRYEMLAQAFEHFIDGRKVLDVGTGPGSGLKAFHDRSWHAIGLEPDPARSQYGRNEFGLNIVTSTVEQFTGADETFDVITLVQVLEHFHNPLAFLSHAVRHVMRGGTFILKCQILTILCPGKTRSILSI